MIKLRKTIFFSALALLLGPFVSGTAQATDLKIAIFDTSFCLGQHKSTNASIKIKEVFYNSKAFTDSCPKNLFNRHGSLVLEHLLKVLPKNKKFSIELHPMVIFDKNGYQNEEQWQLALEESQKRKIDLALLAVGLPHPPSKSIQTSFPLKAFMASGQRGGRIKKDTKLWPQILKDDSKRVMIGSYIPPTKNLPDDYMMDKTLLNLQKIDYLFSGGDSGAKLAGSSRAVTTALGKALFLCPLDMFKIQDFLALKGCLKKHEKMLKDPVERVIFPTY